MQVRIEKMDAKHIDAVVAIEKSSFPSPWNKTMFFQESVMEHSDCYVLILEEETEETLAAYVSTWSVLDECTVNKIACRTDLRRKGYGTTILKHLIHEVSRKGALDIFIEVRESNSNAISFYEKLGFTKNGVREGYYSDTREDAILMSLDVETYYKTDKSG